MAGDLALLGEVALSMASNSISIDSTSVLGGLVAILKYCLQVFRLHSLV